MEKEYWFVIIAGILYGTLVFGGQVFVNLNLSLYEISFLPLLFGLLLLPVVLFKKEYRLRKEMIGLFLGLGLFGTITRLAQFGGVVLDVPVAVVVLLVYTQPFWTIILSKIFLREEITKSKILALILVLTGAVVLVNPFSISNPVNISGIIVALIGGLSFAGCVIYGRKCGVRKYHFITTMTGYIIFTLFFLAVSYPLMALFTKNPSITGLSLHLPAMMWLYLFAFALVSSLIPYALFFKGVQKVPASTAGIILLLEPVSASILAALFLQQSLSLNILFGGALILVSNYLAIRKE